MQTVQKIYNTDLPHRAVSVYVYLCGRADKNGECFPSVRRIAGDLHLCKRTVFRALHDLEEAGMITRSSRKRLHGGNSSCLFRIEAKHENIEI